MKRLDLTGQKFGRLEVTALAGMIKGGSYWACICECGNTLEVRGPDLKNGHTQSCGCYKAEQLLLRSVTHGQSRKATRSKEYVVWFDMIQRCHNPKSTSYKHYGARGIRVCPRWHKFEDFFLDTGICPEGMTLDRKDSNGDYGPENWRRATWLEQQNNRRNNVVKSYQGETKTIAQWARVLGMKDQTLRSRLGRGQSIKKAFTTPVRGSH